ncbi:MAG TPA: methyltransferase domain-containing protein [Phycisphaerales bacterium]|nr:methyltransferase domain-containing protein [Phycisphaerales bacterium]
MTAKDVAKAPSIAENCLRKLMAEGHLGVNDTVFTVCAAGFEHQLFQKLGFKNVVITNLDVRTPPEAYAPYRWEKQDAMQLSAADGSYDWCFVHAGLHHCDSPHRALLELYRVARKGVIAMEARDSLAMRTAVKLGLTGEYELEAVVRNDMKHGGVNNTAVPNYVYRWTEREFIKAISSFNPTGKHVYRFYHGLRLPFLFAGMYKNPLKKWALYAIKPFFTAGAFVFKKQMNHFAMVVIKPREPWPWIKQREDGLGLSPEYVERVFNKKT